MLLDKSTLCKPLVQRELSFYLNIPHELKGFVPKYKGLSQFLLFLCHSSQPMFVSILILFMPFLSTNICLNSYPFFAIPLNQCFSGLRSGRSPQNRRLSNTIPSNKRISIGWDRHQRRDERWVRSTNTARTQVVSPRPPMCHQIHWHYILVFLSRVQICSCNDRRLLQKDLSQGRSESQQSYSSRPSQRCESFSQHFN